MGGFGVIIICSDFTVDCAAQVANERMDRVRTLFPTVCCVLKIASLKGAHLEGE